VAPFVSTSLGEPPFPVIVSGSEPVSSVPPSIVIVPDRKSSTENSWIVRFVVRSCGLSKPTAP
jgi:hypothetical protein